MLSILSNIAKRHSLPTFFVLAYALSWGSWLLSAFVFNIEPLIFFPTGPFFAALIVTALTSGGTGVKAFLHRLVQWRVGLRWYVAALGLPVALTVATVYLNVLLGAPAPTAAQLGLWSGLLVPFLFRLIFIGVGEEPGWRGYALPRLQTNRSALAASLILGVIWAGWHVPIFITEAGTDISAILLVWIPAIFSTTISAILATWLYNSSQGSVVMAILFHASYSTIGNEFFFRMFSGADSVRLSWLNAAAWSVVAIVVVILVGPARLSRTPAQPEVVGEPAAGV